MILMLHDFWPRNLVEISGQLHRRAAVPVWNEPWCPMVSRLNLPAEMVLAWLWRKFYANNKQTNKHTYIQSPWPESASELYRPSDRRLSAKLVPTYDDRGCYVVSVTDPNGRILGFLDWTRYFFEVAPQLYSGGWVDPVTDPLLLRKSGIAGNRTQPSGSVARNFDH
jgi:hypothetical protein